MLLDPRQNPVGSSNLSIVDEDPVYKYAGCWSDTTEFPGQHRALDGPYLNLAGSMTVARCIKFCATARNSKKGGTGWQYAAVEYARECYCGNTLSPHSYHLMDPVCDTPCGGANTTACGGSLALSVYNVTKKDEGGDHPPPGGNGNNGNHEENGNAPGDQDTPEDEAVLQAVGMGVLAVAVAFAVGYGIL